MTVHCPGSEAPVLRMTTGPDGRFQSELPHALSFSCEIRVEKPGFQPRTYALEDVCADPHTHLLTCDALSLPARLAPALAVAAPEGSR